MANAGFIIQPPKTEDELNEIIELLSKISNLDQFVMMKSDGQKLKFRQLLLKFFMKLSQF